MVIGLGAFAVLLFSRLFLEAIIIISALFGDCSLRRVAGLDFLLIVELCSKTAVRRLESVGV